MSQQDFALPPRDHNNAPSDAEILNEQLRETEGVLLSRRDELLAGADRVPVVIESDEIAGKVADFIKQIMAAHKAAEGRRVAVKEPYLAASRVVDGFFKSVTDPLDKAKRAIEARLTAWQRKVAEAERARRIEAERLAREAAEKAAAEAREREAAMKTEADLAPAIAAQEAAQQAAGDVVDASREAGAKAAELSRSRGDLGAVASLRTFWDFSDLDRETLDLAALRHHLPADALEKAVRSFIRAGGRELRGVRIFENTASVVR